MCKSSIYALAALQSNIRHQLTSYNLRKSIIDSLFYLTTQKMLACNWKMLCWCDWNGPNFCMALLPFTVVACRQCKRGSNFHKSLCFHYLSSVLFRWVEQNIGIVCNLIILLRYRAQNTKALNCKECNLLQLLLWKRVCYLSTNFI